MYTIELTQGPGWDAPALRSRPVKTTVDIERVTALAAAWLDEVQHASHDRQMPDPERLTESFDTTWGRIPAAHPAHVPGWRWSK